MKRWTFRRKAELIIRISENADLQSEILAENDISEEEYAEWLRLYNRGGQKGLHVTKLQRYREVSLRQRKTPLPVNPQIPQSVSVKPTLRS